MSKPRLFRMVLVGIFAAITATGYAAPRSTSAAAARKLLDATAATYRHLQSYREEGVIVYESRMPGMQLRMDLHYTLAYRAPNLLYYERGPGMGTLKMVCDGKSLYFSSFLGSQVVKAPAPADAAHLLKPKLLAGYPPMFQAPPFDTTGLISGELNVGAAESVRSGLVRGSRWLASLSRPQGCRVINLQVEGDPTPVVVWIDPHTHAVRQIANEMDARGLRRALSSAGVEPRSGMMGTFRNVVVRTVVTLRKVVINKPIPDALFTFRAPEGAKIVDVKSADELAGPAALGVEEEGPPQSAGPEKSFTDKAPIDFSAVDLDGKPVALTSFRGKPVVVDFCATWCPPCRAELPVLDEAFGKFKDQGLQVVAVFTDDGLETVRKFVAANKYHFTVLWLDPASDAGKQVDKDYGITGIPRTLYIGGDWVVKTDNTGFSGKDETLKALATLGLKSE